MTITHVFYRYVESDTKRVGGFGRADGEAGQTTPELSQAFNDWFDGGAAPAWAHAVDLPDLEPATVLAVFDETERMFR